MRHFWTRLLHLAPLALILLFAAAGAVSAAAACDFAAVKKEIDAVLDRDKDKAARFRRDVAAGYDSMKVLGDLVTPEIRERIDVCRFDAAEYLTKRGFPPSH